MAEPSLSGFVAFIRNVMGITTAQLPDDSPVIPVAYAVAKEIVNREIAKASRLIYQLCVYNLGGSNIINYAQDLPDAPTIPGTDPALPLFASLRAKWNVNGFVSGVIQSASDNGTGESMIVQEAAKNFTLANLQQLKDPYGRQYLAFAQSYGPNLWGLT